MATENLFTRTFKLQSQCDAKPFILYPDDLSYDVSYHCVSTSYHVSYHCGSTSDHVSYHCVSTSDHVSYHCVSTSCSETAFFITFLTNFMPQISSFYSPRKSWKAWKFFFVFRGYRKVQVTWNWLWGCQMRYRIWRFSFSSLRDIRWKYESELLKLRK